jgi:hypothetical protein
MNAAWTHFIRKIFAAISLATLASSAVAGPNYVQGHISNVTFAGDSVLIMIDAGFPDNCANTPSGWMLVPPEYKPLSAFVLGLWLRGDAAQVQVTVYTEALAGWYCRISQIDPAG